MMKQERPGQSRQRKEPMRRQEGPAGKTTPGGGRIHGGEASNDTSGQLMEVEQVEEEPRADL